MSLKIRQTALKHRIGRAFIFHLSFREFIFCNISAPEKQPTKDLSDLWSFSLSHYFSLPPSLLIVNWLGNVCTVARSHDDHWSVAKSTLAARYSNTTQQQRTKSLSIHLDSSWLSALLPISQSITSFFLVVNLQSCYSMFFVADQWSFFASDALRQDENGLVLTGSPAQALFGRAFFSRLSLQFLSLSLSPTRVRCSSFAIPRLPVPGEG